MMRLEHNEHARPDWATASLELVDQEAVTRAVARVLFECKADPVTMFVQKVDPWDRPVWPDALLCVRGYFVRRRLRRAFEAAGLWVQIRDA